MTFFYTRAVFLLSFANVLIRYENETAADLDYMDFRKCQRDQSLSRISFDFNLPFLILAKQIMRKTDNTELFKIINIFY